MNPDLHAVLFLATASITVFSCIRGWKGPPERKRLFATLAMTAAVALVGGSLAHGCSAGQPTSQVILGVITSASVLFCVSNPRRAFPLALVLAGVMVLLGGSYNHLVHQDGYLGTAVDWKGVQLNEKKLRAEQERLRKEPRAGWVKDLESTRTEVSLLWHTPFTGIRKAKRTPIGLWTPDGTADTLEWKDR